MTHALIVDDNTQNVNVLIGLLKMEGITSTQVTNPHQLDDVLSTADPIDIIFLDLEMPGMNGYEVFDKLRANESLNGVPIVACTIHISEINTASQYGFDSFIGKPINPDKFPDQVEAILKGGAVWETV